MSSLQTVLKRHDRRRWLQPTWRSIAPVLFALALVLAVTFALVSAEMLLIDAGYLSEADLVTILTAPP